MKANPISLGLIKKYSMSMYKKGMRLELHMKISKQHKRKLEKHRMLNPGK